MLLGELTAAEGLEHTSAPDSRRQSAVGAEGRSTRVADGKEMIREVRWQKAAPGAQSVLGTGRTWSSETCW